MTEAISNGILHEVPEDLQITLAADADLLRKWNGLTPIQRNEWICWVTIVKKAETRSEHIQRLSEDVKEGRKAPAAGLAVHTAAKKPGNSSNQRVYETLCRTRRPHGGHDVYVCLSALRSQSGAQGTHQSRTA